jgi:hypothetical protein
MMFKAFTGMALVRAVGLARCAYRPPFEILTARSARSGPAYTEIGSVAYEPEFYSDNFTGVHAMLLQMSENEHALSIRGTNGPMDMIYDAQTCLIGTNIGAGKAHLGFYLQQRRLMRLCENDLRARLSRPGASLLCTGHSAGAAIAVLTAYHMTNQFSGAVSVVGFGTPRIGNAAFAQGASLCLADRMLLVKNGADVVVELPPFKEYASMPHMAIGQANTTKKAELWHRIDDHDIAAYQRSVEQLVNSM